MALVVLTVTLTGEPADGSVATSHSPSGTSEAHSAYGLQLSVPRSWVTEYFENCPQGRSGTLLIGTPLSLDNCADYPEDANIVTMQLEKSEAVIGSQERNLVVHGLHVTSYSVAGTINWDVHSKGVVITARGSGSPAVLRTLRLGTSRAHAAPGILEGSEYLEALKQTPVTGLVTMTRHSTSGSPSSVVHAYDGQFSALLPPGRYRVTGGAGDAPCPPATTVARSGTVTVIPPIDCQGM
jgi:hypothetical protein